MMSYTTLLLLLLLLLIAIETAAWQPMLAPYFFLCNYHGNPDTPSLEQGEVALSVAIEGNPEYYIPGQKYEVTITSSQDFDGFMLTGLYTMKSDMPGFPLHKLPALGMGADEPFGQNFMCLIVHNHISHERKHALRFVWMAPQEDTGCISFLATATLGHQVLFKDTIVMQLCEEGAVGIPPPRPTLTAIHTEDGIIFRDDFDSSPWFNTDLWSVCENVVASTECGPILHGQAAVACKPTGPRILITQPLNLTSASVVQYTMGTGQCQPASAPEPLHYYYSHDDKCAEWTYVESIPAPMRAEHTTHIQLIPPAARRNHVCLKWEQTTSIINATTATTQFSGCWAIDNFFISSNTGAPKSLADNFDPVDPSNWLFFPGAKIKHHCHSENHAMVYQSDQHQHNYLSTRDLDLIQPHSNQLILADTEADTEAAIFHEDFHQTAAIKEWFVQGGRVDRGCGTQGAGMIMAGVEKTRMVCTPRYDLSGGGNLRFNFGFGVGGCQSGDKAAVKVTVYAEDEFGHSKHLAVLLAQHYRGVMRLVSVTIIPAARRPNSRLCWLQKHNGGLQHDTWTLDGATLLPAAAPVDSNVYVQFSLSLHCGQGMENTSVALEYSTDHGLTYHPLYDPCLPAECPGHIDPHSSLYRGEEWDNWNRITEAVPSAALTPHTRFRWKQHGQQGNWAIDNVFIGHCDDGCHGQGTCTETGCVCDFGFEGATCGQALGPLPTLLIEAMSSIASISTNFASVEGASLAYHCGVVSSGRAVVFHKAGPRKLETVDVNTTHVSYLQFSVRVGSASVTGPCPPPDQPDELILLHYTCSGGVTWSLMETLTPHQYTQPKVVSVHLPFDALDAVCRFRWWQPRHSGAGWDVWAVDDVSLTDTLYNTISLNDFTHPGQTVDVHLGETKATFCGRDNVLSFTAPYQEGEFRYVITSSMQVAPSYMLQFELVMGCSHTFAEGIDNRLYLEYSVDHGMSWSLVLPGCWPPGLCPGEDHGSGGKEGGGGYHAPSEFHATQFPQWSRVTIPLPSSTWSSSTRFRFRQSRWTATDSWGISSLYIGQQCPHLCHGHGQCQHGRCKCDKGFAGLTCTPVTSLPSRLHTDFSLMSRLNDDWSAVLGGSIVGANQGCGTVLSGESMYFSQDGPRQLVSHDLDTLALDYLQFYAQLGGGNDLHCLGVDSRSEHVLVQYSDNAGVTWRTLKELQAEDFAVPSFVHVHLPASARTSSTRLRWWQPLHSGAGIDQWAIDEVMLGSYHNMDHIMDDFEALDPPAAVGTGRGGDEWLTITEGMYAVYCQSPDDTLMFADQNNDKMAVTTDMLLRKDDVIQFRINVGCSSGFSFHQPVLLQYSEDAGMSWHLVHKPCYLHDHCQHGVDAGTSEYTEGSVYYTGTYGEWTLVVLPVPQEILDRRVNFRWWQKGGPTSSFALDDVYIGPPCMEKCHGNGVCSRSRECKCNDGFKAPACLPQQDANPAGMTDRFDNVNRPGAFWDRILGGALGMGCGVIGTGNSLYFSGDGSRLARTIPLNTTHISLLQFDVRIGDGSDRRGCRKPHNRDEGVVVDYSTNNGIDWHVLKTLDPQSLSSGPQTVMLDLPHEAKTPATVLRWWQPIITPGSPRAEWALDGVVVAVNDSSMEGFEEDFGNVAISPGGQPEGSMDGGAWYMAMNAAVPRVTCHSASDAMEFSKNGGRMRYAETWDYRVTPETFLQFDLAMGCSGLHSTLYGIALHYSTDRGRSWLPVSSECLPPDMDCSGGGYHQSSVYTSDAHANWTRVTVYLPPGAISPATRFRWLQEQVTLRGNVWALDNVYLGAGCPWMCSGHGYCINGKCVCDAGYFGPYCVPSVPLPMGMSDTFDAGTLDRTKWPQIHGGEVTNICGLIVAGTALAFYKEDLRLVTSQDLDVSMASYVQFMFDYGCQYHMFEWPRQYAVLLQYSNNGGIMWSLLKEIHYVDYDKPRFYNIPLPGQAQTNATRFRFWQPKHSGHMKSVWTVDNFYVGGSLMNPSQLYETFDEEPELDSWLFYPGGKIGAFCSYNTRSDAADAGLSSIVFNRGPGEHSITTRDIVVNGMSTIQFDINVGCSAQTSGTFPVHLQYSVDSGRSWHHVIPPCSQDTIPTCQEQEGDATVYYAGGTPYWRRVVVPLYNRQICGSARFRWYQGVFTSQHLAPEWSIDEVYVGAGCKGHCSGHGMCLHGMMCLCDDGYGGDNCHALIRNPTALKEDFESMILLPVDPTKWWTSSGGEPSRKCGVLLSGNSMYFHDDGARELATNDLDLSMAQVIQFFLRLGCGKAGNPIPLDTEPVLLQYSTDGGIHWTTIETLSFQSHISSAQYVAVHMPERACTNSTRVRWRQNSMDATFTATWAIDQIYIGGELSGRMVLSPSVLPPAEYWLMTPGSTVDQVCGLHVDALSFNAPSGVRYAVTADVAVTEATYLQFYIAVGCSSHGKCYSVNLQYSVDFGKTWHMVAEECMPSQVECSQYHTRSVFSSDIYNGWHRVTIPLPFYTRSKTTRFRWVQYGDYEADDTWALTHVYIGDECPDSCSGHGRCDNAVCLCDDGWHGEICSSPISPLSRLLSDSFTLPPGKNNWSGINGGQISDKCGVLAAGPQLLFDGACSRQLITKDLDLSEAQFVQFYFRFGCVSGPKSRDEGVIVDFSVNGGTTWNKMMELFYDMHKEESFVMAELPKEAQREGVRIRWWQPHHSGHHLSDWAIDNVFVGGKNENPNEVVEEFRDAPGTGTWIEHDNTELRQYCGRSSTVTGHATDKEHVKLTTTDVAIKSEDYILQFSISVGCDGDWDADVSPVHLEFSTDLGMSWRHVHAPCLPFFPACNGGASQPTVYYAHRGWRREIIRLQGPLKSRATRFRWMQVRDPSMAAGDQSWALDHVYIGPACTDACNGHGICDYPQCLCDKGYGGKTCTPIVEAETYLKDTFSSGLGNGWMLLQGGHVEQGCRELVQGNTLHFPGRGQRQAVTTDLDLRDARFIQYTAMIGSTDVVSSGCSIPKSRNDTVLLQYSTDGGISWTLLHLLDYSDYWLRPRHDYIPLPLPARTARTRIRWWQMTPHDHASKYDTAREAAAWSLDDVYIGGTEINPSELYQDFEGVPAIEETVWEFYPRAALWNNVCGRRSAALTWEDKAGGVRSLTTGQLIVQEHYILQFKLVVGCGSPLHQCDEEHPVILQYNKSPTGGANNQADGDNGWKQVYPRCLLNGHETNMECRPYRFHPGTVYSANQQAAWTRVTMTLPTKVFSSETRFRWIQEGNAQSPPMWSIDDIYIGEECPALCTGRGDCVKGRCHCDPGYYGERCHPSRSRLLSHMADGFEGGVSPGLWERVDGGGLGLGCGSLHPLAHGKTLYFNGCGQRQVITAEMDVTKASKVMFVLQIGSTKQTPTCNVNLASSATDGTILLQYTVNKGIEWHLLATHEAGEFLVARRVGYEIPEQARYSLGVQFRWWQPQHRGTGHDQWAIDQVEIIMSRHDHMLQKKDVMASLRRSSDHG